MKIKKLLKYILKKIPIPPIFHFIVHDDYKIYLSNTDLSLKYFFNRHGGPTEYNFYNGLIKTGDIFVDIGANIGTVTIQIALRAGIQGSVISFEPNENSYKHLLRNINLNKLDNIETFNIGLGSNNQKIGFSYNDTTSHVSNNHKHQIEIKRLDDINALNRFDSIDLLKIDCEGYELEIIKGAESLLNKTKQIYMEFSETESKKYNGSNYELFEILEHKNFILYLRKKGSQKLVKIDKRYKQDDHHNHLYATKKYEF